MTTWGNLGEHIQANQIKKKKTMKKKKPASQAKLESYYDKQEVYGKLDF